MAAAICLIFAVVLFRLVAGFSGDDGSMSGLANFSPMAALVLCSAIFFPRKWAIAIPLTALLITDIALNLYFGLPPVNSNTLAILLSFGCVYWIGSALRRREKGRHLLFLLGGSIAGTLIFYVITNSSVWLMSGSSVYPRTIEGWIQCMTVGTPGFPPTYVFLRNSLCGDLLFSAVFWAILVFSEKTHREQLAASQVRGKTTGIDPVRPL